MANLLQWTPTKEELEEQVKGYETLGWTKSFRGISAILFSISSLLTYGAVVFDILPPIAIVDSTIFLVLGLFILNGYKWAMLIAMILWTLEKVYQIMSGVSPLVAVIWWAVFMGALYKAYKVEIARKS